ncbi:probable inactive receptor kinase At5g58300 [Hibiscus syriacus]|uniref:probable inactive receptor kinase At5g58300 n=1 Tax=Hibiscus syriacus TaxID=106335 RepID=UPI0019250613|nr:probable inactive receptor kinase At5g58300 [Hibiscus syriacus]
MKFHPLIAFLLLVLLPLYVFVHVVADLNSDKQALLRFAAAVPHVRKLNWNAETPVCTSWVGITCNTNGTGVIAIRLPGIGLYGTIPAKTIGKLNDLRVLSLRSNDINGSLPSDIPSIPSLQFLFLQHNNLSSILFPTSLSPSLKVMDFSYNSISGTIPSLNLPRLKVLNFSYNNLSGSIPSSLNRFPSAFIGNPLLCGSPLRPCSTVSSPPSASPSIPQIVSQSRHTKSKNKLGTGSIVAIVVGSLAFVFLVLVVIFICCLKMKNSGSRGMLKSKISGVGKNEKPNDFGSGVQEAEKNKLFFFEGCSYNFDLEDLLKASAEVLGKGSNGTTYKAALEEGTQVVVKRLKEVAVGKKEFEQQMELVERVGRHPNVIPLRAYYYSKDEKLLVYNYMPAGSLFALLHGNRNSGRTPLDWELRMKIALGTARGIANIHTEGGGKCTHGNIKSSNVLLTDELEACVSDVGLAPLLNAPGTMSRTIGYRAPEVIETRKITQKSDVYSFGVLLLEMLTAKAPLQQSGHDDVVDLPRWVRSVVREEWTAEVFDVELLRYQTFQEEMVQMLQIGLACVAKTPDMRPTMDETVRMIEDIRQSESKNRTSSEAESNIQTP